MNSTHAFSLDSSFPIAFIWGLVILGSFIGWGQAMGRWFLPTGKDGDLGWGLASAFGLTLFIVLSGPMILLSIFSKTFVTLYLFAGLGLFALDVSLNWKKIATWRGPSSLCLKIVFTGLLGLIELMYAGSVAEHWYNPFDDFAAYFSLAKMLLDTGTLFDPFSFRLVGALGGQTAADTLTVAFLPWKYAHILDWGIAGLTVLGLTEGMVRKTDDRAWTARLLLLALVLTFPMPRANIASELTGVVLCMAFFRVLEWVAERRICGWRAALLLGSVIAAAATLRAHNIFIIALLGLSFAVWQLWEDKQRWREIIHEALLTTVFVIGLLAPWWTVGYRSCRVFLYPLIRGNHRPEFELYTLHLSLLGNLQYIWIFCSSTAYLLFFLPIFFLEPGQQRRLLFILGGILLGISVVFLSQMTFAPYFHLYRYLAPIGLAFGLYSSGVLARQLVATSTQARVPFLKSRTKQIGIIVATVLVFQGLDFFAQSITNLKHIILVLDARRQLWGNIFGPLSTTEADREYREAFACIPPGSKTLIALDYPFLLDYRAHRIFSIDVSGAASPDPGFPYFRGAAPVKQYLLAQGIRYIAHVPFDNSKFLHSRSSQTLSLNGPVPAYRFFAKFEIDFYNNIDDLAKTNRILFNSPTVRVIDLQSP